MGILVNDNPGTLFSTDRMAYELKPYDIECSKCSAEATGSQKELKQLGWYLVKQSLCPKCSEVTVGSRWGRWTVLGTDELRPNYLKCRCECGETGTVRVSSLKCGDSTSCGCRIRDVMRERSTVHGWYGTPEYKAWCSMKGRCSNPGVEQYKNYGARGISVCDRWDVFENFITDMGERPSAKHSLDRIDNNGNYEPSNCRWATQSVQSNNKRTNRRITFDGRTLNLKQWCELLGVNYGRTQDRMDSGVGFVEAVTAPLKTRFKVKTHCVSGHSLFNLENIYIERFEKTGHRICRICAGSRAAKQRTNLNVLCKDCHRTDSGSQMELEQRNWSLTWRGEICGSCEAINKQFAEVFA